MQNLSRLIFGFIVMVILVWLGSSFWYKILITLCHQFMLWWTVILQVCIVSYCMPLLRYCSVAQFWIIGSFYLRRKLCQISIHLPFSLTVVWHQLEDWRWVVTRKQTRHCTIPHSAEPLQHMHKRYREFIK